MKAIFYDRKNNREVSNEELMETNFVEDIVVGDIDGLASQREVMPGETLWLKEKRIFQFMYKSATCPKHRNGDLHCNYEDLIFLRLEE